jgi:hypothetical protein
VIVIAIKALTVDSFKRALGASDLSVVVDLGVLVSTSKALEVGGWGWIDRIGCYRVSYRGVKGCEEGWLVGGAGFAIAFASTNLVVVGCNGARAILIVVIGVSAISVTVVVKVVGSEVARIVVVDYWFCWIVSWEYPFFFKVI